MEKNGLAASASKMLLFQTKFDSLGIIFFKEQSNQSNDLYHLLINFQMQLKIGSNYKDF